MDYRRAGVDIDQGNEAVRRIRSLARATFTSGVLSDIGSYGGLFQLDSARYRDPVLVSSADGVGTKLKVAFMTGRHDTVGGDLVNHCVNDILVQGARPLFFLDYLATGRLSPDVVERVVSGLARACLENGCALIGGETAEMPDFYADGEYDLAGFIVGAVEKSKVIDGRQVRAGDRLVAIPSAGLHTNGFSLARRVLFEEAGFRPDTFVPELGTSVADALLAPHRSYLQVVGPLIDGGRVEGLAHITGGGITENLPRIMPEGCVAEIHVGSWRVPAIFSLLARLGEVEREEMFRTFNMGVGMIVVCRASDADDVISALRNAGEPNAWLIGSITTGPRGVRYV
jgi:phosphoribosylformylglycinamidine cyclo-ligase